MKPQRSYSDPEIACYVLGLDLPEQAEGIQALLAHDDAAAARALKWEAYLLGIVDALPATRPPDEILERIQQTLGMTFEPIAPGPVLGESRDRPRPFAERTRQAPWPDWLHHPAWPHGVSMLRTKLWTKLRATRRPSKRVVWITAAAVVVIVGFAALLIGASLHTTPRTVVHQAVTTAH